MAEGLKIAQPGFPHAEVYRKIVEVVMHYSTNTLDLVGLCNGLACYGARFAQVQRGRELTREEWLEWCAFAYDHSDNETARGLFAR